MDLELERLQSGSAAALRQARARSQRPAPACERLEAAVVKPSLQRGLSPALNEGPWARAAQTRQPRSSSPAATQSRLEQRQSLENGLRLRERPACFLSFQSCRFAGRDLSARPKTRGKSPPPLAALRCPWKGVSRAPALLPTPPWLLGAGTSPRSAKHEHGSRPGERERWVGADAAG